MSLSRRLTIHVLLALMLFVGVSPAGGLQPLTIKWSLEP